MQFGYMSTKSAAMTMRKQIAEMRKAGFDMDDEFAPVFRDDRDIAIASLDAGDVLVVASAACLGTVASDVLSALEGIGKRGATVHDLSTGQTLAWNEQTQENLEFAMRADHENRKAHMARMRKARAAGGKLGGIPAVEWDAAKMKALHSGLAEGLSRDDLAKRLGISRATLQRKLREMRSNKSAEK